MAAPTPMREVAWEAPLVEPRVDEELEQWARQSGMNRAHPLRYFTACPWLARSLVHLARLEITHLDRELADLTVLVVSRDNSCRYCYAVARFLLRVVGMPEEKIDVLEGELVMAELEPQRRLGLEFARRLSRCNPPPSAADVEALKGAGFSRETLLELAYVTLQNVMINRITTIVALPPAQIERLDRGWAVALMRLARPVTRRLLGQSYIRSAPVVLSDAQKQGPFAAEVMALDGLPGARSLRGMLDEAWASPILSRRAKALVFAVVARGLGAERVEAEARGLLADEGLDGAAADTVLAHLASPDLDPVETALLPFVRETLWYEPVAIQRQASALRGALSEAQILEAIGISSLANAVGRLSRFLEVLD